MTTPSGVPEPTLLRGHLVSAEHDLPLGVVVLQDGRIAYAGPDTDLPAGWSGLAAPPGWEPGLHILPGLVDLHCHGAAGGEFGPDLTAGAAAVEHHHRAGSTAVYASLVSALPDQLTAGVRSCAALVGAGLVEGIHLEGPFLSDARRGAQNPAALRDSDVALVERLAATAAASGAPGAVAQMTCAPERCATDLPVVLAGLGVITALGHTDCDVARATQALAAAARVVPRGGRALVTHLFNGMPPMHHRMPGPVAAALAAAGRGEVVLEVVGDGVHLHPATVRMLFDLVGSASIALVTDAMAACGMPPGAYTLGGQRVRVEGRTARLVDGGSIAGGVATLLDEVRMCVQVAGVPLREAVLATTATPAAAMGRTDIGTLRVGARADILAVDDDLAPRVVLRGGRCLTLGR